MESWRRPWASASSRRAAKWRREASGRSANGGIVIKPATVTGARLAAAGVDAVHDSGLCTMCEPALFFSHRRDHGLTGRQAGVVWRS